VIPVSSFSTPQRQLPKMGRGKSTVADPKQTQAIQPKGAVEGQAVAQLKLLFESTDMDSDKTVDRKELHMAFQKNNKLGPVIVEEKFRPDSIVLEQLYTNKDDRVNQEEFGSHLRQVTTEQVENTTVEEKAEARLREVSKSMDSNKDNLVNKEELATTFCVEAEGFNTLFVEVGLNTNFEVLEQLDNFYDKSNEAAKAEAKATGDVVAVTEIKIEGAMLVCCL